jgi:hypothetical protein
MTKKPRDPTDTTHPLYDPTEDPTHRFYLGSKTDAEQKPDPSEEDTYKVGPGFPPNEHKWKPGCPSPNSNGRPRKVPSMKADVKKIFEDALNEKIEVTKKNKKSVLSKLAFGLQQLATQFARGDRYARRDVFTYAATLGVDLQAKEVIEEALEASHEAIVEAAILRRQQQPSAEPSPDDHVKAPPDLIDDDVTKSSPNDVPAASPQQCPPAKKPPAPPMGTPAHIAWLREQNLARQKKNQEGS